MKKLFSFISLILFVLPGYIIAQDGLPEKPEDGNCYAKCVTLDEYESDSKRIMTKSAYKTVAVIPAEYKTVVDTIITRPASKKFTYVPATYRTVRDTVIIKEGFNRLQVISESFTASSEIVEIKPAIGKWELGERLPDCESANPEDCRILCYREYPAVSTSIATKVLDKHQTVDKTPIRSEYKIVSREVEASPARMDEVVIPAKYTTVTRRVLVKDETVKETEIPAVYEEVATQRLTKKGGLTFWKEVACSLPKIGEILPINYELGSASLTQASKRIIDDKIYQFMVTQPESQIELSAHTDSRGSASANMSLSRRRAESVVNYLVGKGINRSRLVAAGKGETELLNKCADGVNCSESEHRLNRRTTFRVLKY